MRNEYMHDKSYEGKNHPSSSTSHKQKAKSMHDKQKKGHNFSKRLYGNLPMGYRKKLERTARYAGLNEHPTHVYLSNIIKSYYMLMSIIFALGYFAIGLSTTHTAFILFVIFSTGPLIPYIVFSMTADKRTSNIEKVLPDFLTLTASNIRSGLTIDKAMLFAAREEFGALATEVKRTAFKIYGGIEIEDAFNDMTRRIDSGHLERTVKLLLEGIKSGGNVATLLEESARDVENSKMIQKEINASVQMYIIFIILAGVIASPVMFSISNYLIESTTDMWSDVDTDGMGNAGAGILTLKPSDTDIDTEFFTFFAAAAISITTIFGGMLISLIKYGNVRSAVKYSPIFTIIALSLFYISKEIVTAAMSGLA